MSNEHTLESLFKTVNRRQLALKLGVSAQAISQWRQVPVSRVLDVERITGVPREELRPDIYPPSEVNNETAA